MAYLLPLLLRRAPGSTPSSNCTAAVAAVSYVFIGLGILALIAFLAVIYFQAHTGEDDPTLTQILYSLAEGCCLLGCIGCAMRVLAVLAAAAIAIYVLIALC